jgi:carbonic anhydrase/acetyltransferase-like protein (isoleucine patch superfamily)
MTIKTFNGFTPTLGERAFVDESAVLYGDIVIGDDASIWPTVAARGDVNHIRIGARTNIQDGSVLHVTRKSDSNPVGHPLVVGDDVTVGHKAVLHGCTIGDRVLVGMGAIILDGATVNDDVIVGAGCLVAPGKNLECGFLYVGSPAKQARPLTEAERDFLRQSAENYVTLKNEYLTQQG